MTTQGISLFPFLAVLLCTMGALIVVLVVLNRQSRLQAAAMTAAESEARRIDAEEAQDEAELRRDIAAWRLDHLRVSRDKTQADLDRQRLRLGGVEEHRRQLEAQLKQLQRALAELDEAQPARADDHSTDEIARLGAEIQSARRQLAEARKRAAQRSPAFSVVPYDGPSPTRRRPIYIECTADRVVIQPEGIVLLASDFDGPMGPGNPLASAVRAARDHLVAQAADPKSPDAEPYPLFLVRPDGIEAYYAARAAMQSWGGDFGYQTVDQDWKLEYPPLDARLAEIERQAIDESRERMKWLAQMSPNRYGAGGDRRGSGGKVTYRVSPLGGLVREGGASLRDSDEAFAGNGRDGHSSSAQKIEPRYGDLNQRDHASDASAISSELDARGEAHTEPDTGETEMNMELKSQPKAKPRSLAETRGANWGLSPAARASNPITRPINIMCQGDKLLLRPERASDPPVVVPLPSRTEESVDQLVAEIQERIKDWGIAGRGLYWRPQLILEVGHSGEGRYSDLEALLADSGFDVKRK